MSTCISGHGEYSEHVPDEEEEFICGRCFLVDEDAMRAEIQRLRADRPPVTDDARAETAPAGLTVSDDGSLLNWQGVNYVPQRAETTTTTTEGAAQVITDAMRDGSATTPEDVAMALASAGLLVHPTPSRQAQADTAERIAQDIDERIAQDIDDARRGAHGKAPGYYAGLAHAARIARDHAQETP